MRAGAVALLAFGTAVIVAAEFVVVGLAPSMSAELALTPARVGFLITVFALASAVVGPVLVALTAHLRPSALLALALLPFAASLLLYPFPTFAMAVALRILQGSTLPLFVSLAGAQLAAARGAGPGIALLYVGVTIGGTLGPPAGAFAAARFGWEAPMVALGAFALIAAAACLLLPHARPSDTGDATWRLLGRSPMLPHLLLSTLIFATLFTGFSYIAILLARTGFNSDAIAFFLLGFGAAGLAGNWLAGKLSRWALAATHWVMGAVVIATAWVALPGQSDAVVTSVAILVWGVAHSAAFVFSQVRVMAVAPEAPSFAGSLNISASNIGIAIGAFAGGLAIEQSAAVLALTTAALAMSSIAVARYL